MGCRVAIAQRSARSKYGSCVELGGPDQDAGLGEGAMSNRARLINRHGTQMMCYRKVPGWWVLMSVSLQAGPVVEYQDGLVVYCTCRSNMTAVQCVPWPPD